MPILNPSRQFQPKSLEKKLKSSPFSPDLCPCCHQNSDGNQYSLHGQADQKRQRLDLLLAGGQGVVQAVEGGYQDQDCEDVQARQINQEDFPSNPMQIPAGQR